MTVRVLHIATRHIPGGAASNTLHFMGWQRRAGIAVDFAIGRDSDAGTVPDEVRVRHVRHLVRDVRPMDDVRGARELRWIVERGAYDVVHTHQSKAGVLGRWAARGRARLVVHTVHMTSFGPGYAAPASAAFRRAERWCAGFTDVLIAVGEELREMYLGAGIGVPDRFRVIRSPIDLSAFLAIRAMTPEQRLAARERLGLREAGPVALVVAALEPRKRVELVLIRLADRLRAGWALVVAGTGPRRGTLEALAGHLGLRDRVRLLGHVDDVPSLMGTADVLVHAALAEGVPQVVLQSLAAGLPVVATEVVGLREVPGAPVAIARVDGADLRALVTRAVDEPPAPVPSAMLLPWDPASVELEIARLHGDLGLGGRGD